MLIKKLRGGGNKFDTPQPTLPHLSNDERSIPKAKMASENPETPVIPDYRKVIRQAAMDVLYEASNAFPKLCGRVEVEFPFEKNWPRTRVEYYGGLWKARLRNLIQAHIESIDEYRYDNIIVSTGLVRRITKYALEISWEVMLPDPFDAVLQEEFRSDEDEEEWENQANAELENIAI